MRTSGDRSPSAGRSQSSALVWHCSILERSEITTEWHASFVAAAVFFHGGHGAVLAPPRSVHVMRAVMERARQLAPFMAELKGAGMCRA
jgi:hypothetical protein